MGDLSQARRAWIAERINRAGEARSWRDPSGQYLHDLRRVLSADEIVAARLAAGWCNDGSAAMNLCATLSDGFSVDRDIDYDDDYPVDLSEIP